MRVTVISIVFGALGTGFQRLGMEPGRIVNQRKNQCHPDNTVVENSQNTEKSPGDLSILANNQTPLKGHLPTWMCKARKE